jgi:hypothetical protein
MSTADKSAAPGASPVPHAPPPPSREASAAELRKKIELLTEFIQSSITDVGNKRKLNRKHATWIKMLILCMSGAATIFLGLNLGSHTESALKNAAFVLSSLVTIFNALEPFFNYRGLWVEHERANAGFYQVKDRMAYYTAGRSDADLEAKEIDKFYDQYEHVWATLNQAWTQRRQQYDDAGKGGKAAKASAK